MKPKKTRYNYTQPTDPKEREFELVTSKASKEKLRKQPTPLNQLEISGIKPEVSGTQSLSQSVKRSNTNSQNEKQKTPDRSHSTIKKSSTINQLIYDPQLIKIRKFMENYQEKFPIPHKDKDEDKGVPIENEALPKKIYIINERSKSTQNIPTQPALIVKRGFVINTLRTGEESKLPEKVEVPKNNVNKLKAAKPKPKPEPKKEIRQSQHIEIEYTSNKPDESNTTPIVETNNNLNTESSYIEYIPKYYIKPVFTPQRTYDDDIIIKTQKILNSSKEKVSVPSNIYTITSQYETIQSEPLNNITFREPPKRFRSASQVKRRTSSPLKINPTPIPAPKPTPTYIKDIPNEDNLFYIYSNKALYDKMNYNNHEVCPSTTIPTYKRRNIYLNDENEDIHYSNHNAYIPSKYKKFNETSKTEYNGVSPSYSLRNHRSTNLYGNVGNLYRNTFTRVKYENEGYSHFNHPTTVRRNRNFYRYMEPVSIQRNDYYEEDDDNLCYRCKQNIKQHNMLSTISH